MVDETKNPTVELDTDDVKETNVEVKETTNDSVKKADLNVGEVDLGYTSHTNKKEEKAQIVVEEEAKQEQPKVETKQENVDDLSNLSEGVQKRIDKLTRKYREAERREQAALDYAKALQKKYSDFEQKYDSGEEMYLKEYEARIDAQREQVKVKLAEAYQSQDVTKITEAQDELTKLTVEKEKARIRVADRENRLKQVKVYFAIVTGKRGGLAPRCRLVTSWGWRRSQGFGCSPIKVARELGSERRETVRSLSVVGARRLRGPDSSTRGPSRTNL